jgi:tetratricopeptide (TPR) repeat protein
MIGTVVHSRTRGDLARRSEPSEATITLESDARAEIVRDERTLRPGERVGRYEVERRVGEGGHAVVFRAIDRELDRTVALKVLTRDPGRAIDAERRERMLREARSLAQLTDPNIVQIFDVGEHGDSIYIAMEFVAHSLHSWLEERHRDWRESFELLVEAGCGLRAAHEAGFVHRDFKPANVLVGDDGRVRVADFGIAIHDGSVETPAAESSWQSLSDDRLTRTGACIGTPMYMSPEQLAGGDLDHRSDQFSFCVAWFRALYGVPPFRGRSAPELRAQIRAGRIQAPARGSVAPRWLDAAIRRGLSVDPADRWPNMAALLEHVQRRRRGGSWRALVVALAGVGIAGAFALGPADEGRLRGAGIEPAEDQPAVAVAADPRSEQLQVELDRVASMYEAGRYREALEPATELVDDTDAIGDVALRARAEYELGRLETELSIAGGIDRIEQAYFDAASLGERDLRTAALVHLIRASASERADYAKADEWARHALAELDAESADDAVRAEVLSAIADVASSRGDAQTARANHRRALELRRGLEGGHEAELAESRLGLGQDYLRHQEFAEAREHLERALELRSEALGADHPDLASVHNALGLLALETGQRKLAVEHYHRGLDIVNAAYGEGHPRSAPILQNLANTTMREPEQAHVYMLEALRLREQAYGPHHPRLAGLVIAVGNSYVAIGNLDAAEAQYRRAAEMIRSAGGDTPLLCDLELARVSVLRGEHDRAIEMMDAILLRDPKDHGTPVNHARSLSRISRMIWETGLQPVRAHALAGDAYAELIEVGAFADAENLAKYFADPPEPIPAAPLF